MKVLIRDNKVLLMAMTVVFIVCFVVIGTRMGVESRNKTYDIVLDYGEIAAMAQQTDYDVSWWLTAFRDMGIDKVGLTEESLLTLMEDKDIHLTSTVMGNVTKDASWQSHYPQELIDRLNAAGYDPFDVMVEIEGRDTVAFVLNAVRERFAPERYFYVDLGETAYVVIDGTADVTLYSQEYKHMNSMAGGFIERIDVESSKIMYISLGLLPEKVETVQRLGMEVIPRTLSYSGWNDTRYAQAVVDGYAAYGIVPRYIIVGGEAVIGFDDGIDFAKNYILDNGIIIGLIENTTQLQNILQYGVEEVAIESGYNAVRVFSVWNYIQYRYQYYGYQGAEEVENTLFRAVAERNIRVIYFKPVKRFEDLHTYVTNIAVYEDLFRNLENRLARQGIHYGPASVMDDYQVPTVFKILFGMGAVFGACLLLRGFLPISRKVSIVLAIIGSACVPAAFYVMPNTAELLASLAAAIVFGCLAVTWYTAAAKNLSEKLDKETSVRELFFSWKHNVLRVLVVSVAIAFFGAMLTAAPISSVSYMLEIDIFRGVKISQLLPTAYFIVAYLAYFGYGNRVKKSNRLERREIKDLLNIEIKLWMILAAALVGGAGAYYILRTGHEFDLVSGYEMLVRNELESLLIARPRTKEFLIAFPAVMLMIYAAVRRFRLWTLLFGLVGTIGMTSVINTFEHIRTPLYLGFFRTVYALFFALFIGMLAILIFEGIYRLYGRYFKERFAIDGEGADG